MDTDWQHLWHGLRAAQEATIAASGTANAGYFGVRAADEHGARRLAAGALAALFAAIALEALTRVLGAPSVDAAARTPLLVATLLTSVLLATPRRQR